MDSPEFLAFVENVYALLPNERYTDVLNFLRGYYAQRQHWKNIKHRSAADAFLDDQGKKVEEEEINTHDLENQQLGPQPEETED